MAISSSKNEPSPYPSPATDFLPVPVKYGFGPINADFKQIS
jgi:hypothetical protein